MTLPLRHADTRFDMLTLSQILHYTDSLPLSRLTPWTFTRTVSSELYRFWATVCKTVRLMLSDRCLSCPFPSVLSVTLVYCGQKVGWIKMKLGMLVGLGHGHIVLDGDPSPPKGA